MKKYGKLIIAFMWLGLTMIMIVGATFAWFSENRNVEANGMTVQAETTKNLVIYDGNASNFDPTNPFIATSHITSVVKLTPASTVNAVNFFTTDGVTKSSKVNYNSGALLDGANMIAGNLITANPAANAAVHAVKHTFMIKVDGVSTATLSDLKLTDIDITRAETDDQSLISKALRIAIFVDGTLKTIYAPYADTADLTYDGIKAVGAVSTDEVTAVADVASGGDVLKASIDTTATRIDVVIWYEGQDSNCTSAKAIKVESLTIKLSFSASDPA